jgi:hypothetical protein
VSDGIHNNKRLLERGASLPSTPTSASEPKEALAQLRDEMIAWRDQWARVEHNNESFAQARRRLDLWLRLLSTIESQVMPIALGCARDAAEDSARTTFAKNAGLYSMSDGIHNNKRLLERGASLPSTPTSASEPSLEERLLKLCDPDCRPYGYDETMWKSVQRDWRKAVAELVRLRGLETKLRALCHSSSWRATPYTIKADELRAILSEEKP